MNYPNCIYKKMSSYSSIFSPGILLMIALMMVITACAPTPPPTPLPTATATPFPQRSSFNDNVQAMNTAQTALSEMTFGFAPLLLEQETRVTLNTQDKQSVARLAYPLQPDEPTQWPAGDSFILAYATRNVLLTLPQVDRVALGNFDLAAPVANLEDTVSHVAVWVTFADRTQAIIDLSPLSTDFAAQHKAPSFTSSPVDLESQFAVWREGVFLNELQPMKVLQQEGETYYLLAGVTVHPDRYEFSLRAHITQVADPMQPLRLVQGALVDVHLDRLEFEELQTEIKADGPDAFRRRAELFIRQGSENGGLKTVLDDHLHLLWHLITKLEHEPLDPDETIPATPTPTLTPSPTPTLTPTPTPKRSQPLITS